MTLKGINGEALYAMLDGKVVMLTKPSLNNDLFKVHINRDTLILGDTLSAIFMVSDETQRMEIDSPVSQVITNDRFEGGVFYYDFKTNQLGVHLLSGTIGSDSLSIPFELKFLVQEP